MANINGNEIFFGAQVNITEVPVVQGRGNSEVAVMSQKAVTQVINDMDKKACDNFSNALKATAMGDLVSLTDAVPFEHEVDVKVTCPDGVEPTAVKVKVCGKNLSPTYSGRTSINEITVTINEDGSLTFNGTATADTYFHFVNKDLIKLPFPTNRYTVSIGVNLPTSLKSYLKCYLDGVSTFSTSIANGTASTTFAINSADSIDWYMYIPSGITLTDLTLYPQIAIGDDAEYEPYNAIEYTPDANGTTKAISKALHTNILTDTYGVTIQVEYHRDINGAFATAEDKADLERKITEEVSKETEKYFTTTPSVNLFDKNDADMTNGLIYENGSILASTFIKVTGYIKVSNGKTYTFPVYPSQYGWKGEGYALLYNGNKEFIGVVKGNYIDAEANNATAIMTVTIDHPSAVYLRTNVGSNEWTTIRYKANNFMVVEGDTYPNDYSSYGDTVALKPSIVVTTASSPLLGKKIALNGDSICYGAGSTGGYGKIIADEYKMTLQNLGVSGGTITAETYASDGSSPRHWICRTISNMDADSDYAIVEGGVNDASLSIPLGSLTSGLKATLDDTTFYGAFESMCKQLLMRFAGKKIGYIAVHQMHEGYSVTGTDNYYWASKKCCEKWGIPFLDLNSNCPPFGLIFPSNTEMYPLREAYTHNADGWHPNEEGYKKYYVPKIVKWLESL